MSDNLGLILQGLGVGGGLIIAIGAQNAFVLRQGLKRNFVFAVALTSILGDYFLILLGLIGVGTLITHTPILSLITTWGGALFLFIFGLRAFRSARQPAALEASRTDPTNTATSGLRSTIAAALAFSLLNPHAYLDMVVIIGSVGAKYPLGERLWFGMGALLASTIWFFGLAYGARWLAPLFQRPVTWRVLDVIIGCVMWLIAFTLIF